MIRQIIKIEHLWFSMQVTLFPLWTWNWAYEYIGNTHNLNFGVRIYRANSGLWSLLIFFLDIFKITDALNNLLWRVKFLFWIVYDPTQITWLWCLDLAAVFCFLTHVSLCGIHPFTEVDFPQIIIVINFNRVVLNANVSLETVMTVYLLWSWANTIIHFCYQNTFLLCCFLFVYQQVFWFFFLSHILSYWAFILDFPQVLEEVSCTTLLFIKYSSSGFCRSSGLT